MGLIRWSAILAFTYGAYHVLARRPAPYRAAFAEGESTPGPVEVRNAGPAAMADEPPHWDAVDQASDESYPASDPPAANRFT